MTDVVVLPKPEAADVVPAACVNCGAALTGPYCAACGQPVRTGRLRLGELARSAFSYVFSFDTGLLHTWRNLFTRPVDLVRDVWRGRTRPYTNPIRYYLIWITVAQLATLLSGQFDSFAAGFADNSTGDVERETVAQRAGDFYVIATAALLPFLALMTRWVFRRRGYTLAEHFVPHLYGAGQVAFFWVVGIVLDQIPGRLGLYSALAAFASGLGWYLWSMAGVFDDRRVRGLAKTALAGLGALLLYLLAIVIVFGLIDGIGKILAS